MAVTLPAAGYISDNTRTKGEVKAALEEFRDAIAEVDTNTDALTVTVAGFQASIDANTTAVALSMTKTNNLSDVTDVALSRTNINVYSKAEALSVANNLSDLADDPTARTNLDVYSKAEALSVANNLSDIANAPTARNNLGLGDIAVFDTGTTTGKVPQAQQIVWGGWTTPTLNAGYTTPGGERSLQYRSDFKWNNIQIRGSVTSAVAPGTVFTLDVSYRPIYLQRAVVDSALVSGAPAFLEVQTSGDVVLFINSGQTSRFCLTFTLD